VFHQGKNFHLALGSCLRERNSNKRREASFPLPEAGTQSAGAAPPTSRFRGYLRYGPVLARASCGILVTLFPPSQLDHGFSPSFTSFAVFRRFLLDCSSR
jgi:hypothetical protein